MSDKNINSELPIDPSAVSDWNSFHDLMAFSFGLPDFYGSNSDAFIDCQSDIDDPDPAMCGVSVARGGIFTLHLIGWSGFKAVSREIAVAFIECIEFVNTRLNGRDDGTRIEIIKR